MKRMKKNIMFGFILVIVVAGFIYGPLKGRWNPFKNIKKAARKVTKKVKKAAKKVKKRVKKAYKKVVPAKIRRQARIAACKVKYAPKMLKLQGKLKTKQAALAALKVGKGVESAAMKIGKKFKNIGMKVGDSFRKAGMNVAKEFTKLSGAIVKEINDIIKKTLILKRAKFEADLPKFVSEGKLPLIEVDASVAGKPIPFKTELSLKKMAEGFYKNVNKVLANILQKKLKTTKSRAKSQIDGAKYK